MTLNLHIGDADATQVVRVAHERRVDVLALEEITPEALSNLRSAGLDRMLPNRIVQSDVHGLTTGVWSRRQLIETRSMRTKSFHLISARTYVPGSPHSIDVTAIHIAGPSENSGSWRTALGRLHAVMRSIPESSSSAIMAGDFGATWDVSQFRDAVATGYSDGAEQAGAGIAPTYPANRWYGPLVSIDHVLTRKAVTTTFDTFDIHGSDHRAVVAVIAIPK